MSGVECWLLGVDDLPCWVLGVECWVLMNSQGDVGVSPHSYHDTSSEGGVTSVITPLSIRRGAGGEASVGCWVMGVGC